MKTQIICFCLMVTFVFSAKGQEYSDDQMHTVENRERIYYSYKDSLLGCNYAEECRGFTVKFSTVYFDRNKNIMRIRGNVYDLAEDRPIRNTEVFVAKRTKDKLIRRELLYTTRKRPNVKPPYDMGKFDVSFKIKQGCYLYLSHPSYALAEFDVNTLVQLSLPK